ncbi:MAG TPA: hypothetical protein VIQ00_14990 [Chitinophagaceae bacterium]
MKITQKKKREIKELHPSIMRILLLMNNGLKRCADWLQQKTNAFSIRKQKIILIVFCALFVSESLLVIHQSFRKGNADFYFITPIRTIPLLRQGTNKSSISKDEFSRIHGFKIYLDSLQATSNGKLKSDSFLSSRPFLLDTIHYLENIYYEQETNRK